MKTRSLLSYGGVSFCLAAAVLSPTWGAEEKVGLSKDQKKVVERHGWPASFTVIDGQYEKDSEEARYEAWNYPDQDRTLAFKDGKFMGITALDDPAKGKYRRNPLKPTMFSRELTKAEVIEILGKGERVEYGKFDDGKVESFAFPGTNVAVVFLDGHLWTVKTNLLEPATKGKKK